MSERVTFWLYYGGRVLTAIRCDATTSADEVRRLALEQHERVPLVDLYETPHERAIKIRRAEVRPNNPA